MNLRMESTHHQTNMHCHVTDHVKDDSSQRRRRYPRLTPFYAKDDPAGITMPIDEDGGTTHCTPEFAEKTTTKAARNRPRPEAIYVQRMEDEGISPIAFHDWEKTRPLRSSGTESRRSSSSRGSHKRNRNPPHSLPPLPQQRPGRYGEHRRYRTLDFAAREGSENEWNFF